MGKYCFNKMTVEIGVKYSKSLLFTVKCFTFTFYKNKNITFSYSKATTTKTRDYLYTCLFCYIERWETTKQLKVGNTLAHRNYANECFKSVCIRMKLIFQKGLICIKCAIKMKEKHYCNWNLIVRSCHLTLTKTFLWL